MNEMTTIINIGEFIIMLILNAPKQRLFLLKETNDQPIHRIATEWNIIIRFGVST
jgi:hypothetical protein